MKVASSSPKISNGSRYVAIKKQVIYRVRNIIAEGTCGIINSTIGNEKFLGRQTVSSNQPEIELEPGSDDVVPNKRSPGHYASFGPEVVRGRSYRKRSGRMPTPRKPVRSLGERWDRETPALHNTTK